MKRDTERRMNFKFGFTLSLNYHKSKEEPFLTSYCDDDNNIVTRGAEALNSENP